MKSIEKKILLAINKEQFSDYRIIATSLNIKEKVVLESIENLKCKYTISVKKKKFIQNSSENYFIK